MDSLGLSQPFNVNAASLDIMLKMPHASVRINWVYTQGRKLSQKLSTSTLKSYQE